MSISQLPIIKQLIDIFAVIMNWVYDTFAAVGIYNAIAYIIMFAILSKILLLPFAIKNFKRIRANAILEPVNNELKNKYKKLDKKIFQNRMHFEKFVLLNKYDNGSNSGCATFFVQFPILIAIYYVVGHLTEFVPEIAQMTETDLSVLYSFAGLDIRDIPGTTLLAVFPICTIILQLLDNITMDLLNKRKINASNLFSNFLTAYLGFKFPTFLSIYWLAQNVFSFIISLILTLYFNTKDEKYFIDKKLIKLNKERVKRGLEPLSNPIDIIEEDVEAVSLYEKELGITDEYKDNKQKDSLENNVKKDIEECSVENFEEKILEAEKELEEGKGMDAKEALHDLKEKYFPESVERESE